MWDIWSTDKPINSITVYEPLKSKLCDYYENDCIFDKFSIGLSPDGTKFVTGLYD
jgi:serine/threonine-protein phosphatase 2A regulatory subunit B